MLRTWNMNHQAGHVVNVQLSGPMAYQMAMMDHHRAMSIEAKHMAEADKCFWDHKRAMHDEIYGLHEKAWNDMGGQKAMMSMMNMMMQQPAGMGAAPPQRPAGMGMEAAPSQRMSGQG